MTETVKVRLLISLQVSPVDASRKFEVASSSGPVAALALPHLMMYLRPRSSTPGSGQKKKLHQKSLPDFFDGEDRVSVMYYVEVKRYPIARRNIFTFQSFLYMDLFWAIVSWLI